MAQGYFSLNNQITRGDNTATQVVTQQGESLIIKIIYEALFLELKALYFEPMN